MPEGATIRPTFLGISFPKQGPRLAASQQRSVVESTPTFAVEIRTNLQHINLDGTLNSDMHAHPWSKAPRCSPLGTVFCLSVFPGPSPGDAPSMVLD